MNSQMMSIEDVKLNPNNPRIIKDHKFKKLVSSIQSFPEMLDVRPIVVNKDMIVLGGNMRLKACQAAGLKEIPVIVTDFTEEQQNEFTMKDNISFGEWDWEMLANQWEQESLIEWGMDVPKFETIGEIDSKGRMNATLDEKLDTYINATIKQIVLYYEHAEYEEILIKIDKIAAELGLPDNSSVIKYLCDEYGK